MDTRPIGLFDSGVGGLSVLQEIKKLLPKENFVFIADQKHIPYGAKSKKELEKLSLKITKFLLKFDIKMLVVACNTATCYALDSLRSSFTIPIIGVVPAVKPAAGMTKNSKIAVMSTPATSKSTYLHSLLNKFAKNLNTLNLGCKGLEDSVEILDQNQITLLLDKYIKKIKSFDADVVILGCTHYPFLKQDIKKRLTKKVKIIDSGKSIAKRVKFILEKEDKLSNKKNTDVYFTTAKPQEFSKVASILLQYKIAGEKASI